MAHAETQQYVEVRAMMIQNLGLEDGVAGRFVCADEDLFLVLDANRFLQNTPDLADDAHHLETLPGKYVIHHSRFNGQTDAEGQAEFFGPYLIGKLAYLLDPRLARVKQVRPFVPFEVTLAFLYGRQAGEFTDFGVCILLIGLLVQLF